MGKWGDFLNGDRVRAAIAKIQISEIVLSFSLLNVYIIPMKCFVIMGTKLKSITQQIVKQVLFQQSTGIFLSSIK